MRVILLILSFLLSIETSGAENIWTTYTNENGLVYNKVTAITIDSDNIKWFVQYLYSGYVIEGITTSTFDDYTWREQIPLRGKSIHHILSEGNIIWLQVSNVHIYSYHDSTRISYSLDVHGINNIIFYNDIMWIADGGDFEYQPKVLTFDGENSTVVYPSFFIGDFAVDSRDNLWMAGYGLYRYNYAILHRYNFENIEQYYLYNHIIADHNDVIWGSLGSSFNDIIGVVSYNNGEWALYTPENSGLIDNFTYINSIEVDHNDIKWIGTDAGVCRFDGETWTTFNTENSGLCNNKVNAIAVETNNTIWFGTDNGVSRYTGEIITTGVDEEEKTPKALPVIHSYPNPFNPSTTIEFTLPESGFTTLSIYNISGQKVRELTADYMTAGTHSLTWDGRDGSGDAISSGVYITRLVAGKQVIAGRMILLK